MLIQHALPRLRPLGGPSLRIRRDHRLAQELRAYWLFGGDYGLGFDLVTGTAVDPVNSPGISTLPEGPAMDLSGAAYGTAPALTEWDVLGDITVAWRGMIRTLSAGNLMCKIPLATSGGSNTPFSLEYGNPTSARLTFTRSNSGFRAWMAGADSLTANQITTLAASQGADISVAPLFYTGGALVGGTPASQYGGGGSGAPTGNTNVVQFGTWPTAPAYQDGLTAVAALGARIWDADEHLLFELDPYGLIEEGPRFYVVVPGATSVEAGAGSASGSATAAATGSTIAVGAGASSGVATTAATGVTVARGAAAAAGAATVGAVGQTVAAGAASAAGTATTGATGVGIAGGAGAAAASATAGAAAQILGVGQGAAAGTATASAVGVTVSIGSGSATGGATVGASSGSGAIEAGAGSAAGTATVQATGVSIGAAVAAASGAATAGAVGVGLQVGSGAASGLGAAQGVGVAIQAAAGAAVGVAVVSAVGRDASEPLTLPPASRTYAVPAQDRSYAVPASPRAYAVPARSRRYTVRERG